MIIKREWCAAAARREGNGEVGAGVPNGLDLLAEVERLRATLRNVRGYIKDCDHEPAIDEIDAALAENH